MALETAGAVITVLDVAEKINNVVQAIRVMKDQKEDREAFMRFLVRLIGILSAAENGLAGEPDGSALLQQVLREVQDTITQCHVWAKKHHFLHALSDKSNMAAFELRLQKHLLPLDIAQGASASKVAEAHERSSQGRHNETVDGLVRIHEQVAGPKGLNARFDAIDKEGLAARQQHNDSMELMRKEADAHWKDLVKRSDATIEHIMDVGANVVEVNTSVAEGRVENRTGFASVHAMLQKQPEEVAALVLAGLRAENVAPPSIEEVRFRLADYRAELTEVERTLSTVVAPDALKEPRRIANQCHDALASVGEASADASSLGSIKNLFAKLRQAVEMIPCTAFKTLLSDSTLYVPPPELEAVVQHVCSRGADGVAPRPVWLHGAPGVGKSALARALHDHYHSIERLDDPLRRKFPSGVLLLQWGPSSPGPSSAAKADLHEGANTRAARWLGKLQMAEDGLAVHLNCTSIADSEEAPAELLMRMCRVVRHELCTRKLLLIIDDVWPEDFCLFGGEWLALDTLQGGTACVLTSRFAGLAASGGIYKAVPVKPLDKERAQRILHRHAFSQTDVFEAPVAPEIQGTVRELALKCGGHALTLKLAAGAVKWATMRLNLPEAGVAQWKGVLDDLMDTRRHLGNQKPSDFVTPLQAYAMSVEQQTEHGKSILSTLCLFPAVHRAPKEMVHAIWRAQSGTTHLATDQADKAFEAGIDALKLANIIDLHAADSGDLEDMSFHLLLATYLEGPPPPLAPHKLPSTDLKASAAVVQALLSLSSAGGREDAGRLLHTQLAEPDVAGTLGATANALNGRACFGEALAAQQQALAIRRTALGDAHPDTAASLDNVGGTLWALGRHEEALEHEQQALAIRRTALGDAHPSTATSLNNVGGTLGALGRHEEALEHQQQALAILRNTLGDAHPDTATSLNNVGGTLWALGRHEEALEHQQQALAIRRTALGDAHPDTATSLNNVGGTLWVLGRHKQAEQKVLTIGRSCQSHVLRDFEVTVADE